jgi:hypothetical protein
MPTLAWGLIALALLGGLFLLFLTLLRVGGSLEIPPEDEPVADSLLAFCDTLGVRGLELLELALERAEDAGSVAVAIRETFAELVQAGAYCGAYQIPAAGRRIRCDLYHGHPGRCRSRYADRRLAWIAQRERGPELSIWLGQELPKALLEPLFALGALPAGWGTHAFRPAEISPPGGLEWTTSAQRRAASLNPRARS